MLNNDNLKDVISKMIEESIQSDVDLYLTDGHVHDDWNMAGLRDHFLGYLTTPDDLNYTVEELAEREKSDVVKLLTDRAKELYAEKEREFGEQTMRELERVILLKNVDTKWINHIDAIDVYKRQDKRRPL